MKSTRSLKRLPTKAAAKGWEVYIIETKLGKLYTGITNDFNRRFSEHVEGKKGAKFFHFSDPKQVLFREAHKNRSTASRREAEIKKMSRTEKLALINL